MSLPGLLPMLYDRPEYRAVAERVASGEASASDAPYDPARPYMLAALHADVTMPRGRPMIVVTPRTDRARLLYEGLLAYSPPGTPVYFFPAPDLLPYERIAPDPTIVGERLRVLASFERWNVGTLERSASGPTDASSTGVDNDRRSNVQTFKRSNVQTAPIIVTSVFALMQPTLGPSDMEHATRMLRRGDTVEMRELLEHMVNLGYESSVVVEEPGQFSRRGGIIDLFPPTSSLPIRIELFGNEIDSIRVFSPLTQRSERQANAVLVTPSCELPLWKRDHAAPQLRAIDTSNLREEVLEEWQLQLDKTEAGERFEGMELFAPYYVDELASLADYLAMLGGVGKELPLLVLDDLELIRLEAQELERQAGDLYRGFIDNGELPPGLKRPYLTWEEVAAHGRDLPALTLGSSAEGEARGPRSGAGGTGSPIRGSLEAPPFSPPHLYSGNVAAAISDLKEMMAARSRIVIVSQQSGRLRELLEDEDIYPTVRKGSSAVIGVGGMSDSGGRSGIGLTGGPTTDPRSPTPDPSGYMAGVDHVALSEGGTGVMESLTAPPAPGSVNLLQGSLHAGWQLMSEDPHQASVVLLTDAELFGRSQVARRQAGPARRSTADAAAILREKMLLELQTGDYVVHVEHGIAKYGGLVRMTTDGTEREYMLLLYAEGDRLYVPADQTDRVAPYIGMGPPPHLHRLGTADWSRTKKRVKQEADKLAKELLQLYAAREMAPGHAYPADTPWQHELEESFPYIETPDQLRAISEVKADMEQPQPMDRLVCGDVGYGKTEVALRAAFKAVMDGRQVAVLVPTTVLAQQHYNTFSERLAVFPVSIEMLSRFRSKQAQTRIVRELGEGRIDILVGTHMLLSKSVQFKNLGLVIIDEEQRFGVRHKERLKQLRAEVDVITLSATPIPRTLHMAISGVRDLSLIETPPETRLPIKTYVTAYRPQLVREVILRELERGGQVFFVHNRVETIEKLREELEALVPEARFVVGHGQMHEDHLEKVMAEFVSGRADVLLCTTIIESGLDIPNANTLIVDHADKLGLAQLYQLRGRVGRGANRAYSYFLYHAGRKVTETARERLSTIEQATELGAGFRIALKDLEIRGAGNLLGPEQSGHVAAVGFDLYTRLLATAVEKARAERRILNSEFKVLNSNEEAAHTIQNSKFKIQNSEEAEEQPGVSLDLPLTAYLPEEYVPDDVVRLRLYQRMAASMTPSQVRELAKELEDRFGPLPEPAANLLEVVRLKGLAIAAGVERISAMEHEILVQTPEARTIPESVRMSLQRKHKELVKTSPHQVRIIRARAGNRWKDILESALEEMRDT